MKFKVRSSKFKVFVVVLCVLCALCGLLLADSATNLRPTADGGSEQWTNNAGTSCASATCYPEVNEASGANCSTTPGDSTSNKSTTTANQVQRYDVDESSIPDGSSITQVTVYGCLQRAGAQNANFRFLVARDGAVTNCATTSTSTSTFTDFNCAITVSWTKQASSDIEIGWENTQARAVNGTAIKADVTYTPPGAGGPRRVFVAQVRPRQ